MVREARRHNEFSRNDYRAIKNEGGRRCAYCGDTEIEMSAGRRLTVHHKIPISMGGAADRSNGVVLCKPGCHDFFDELAQENGVTYDEYIAETERLRRKDPGRQNASH